MTIQLSRQVKTTSMDIANKTFLTVVYKVFFETAELLTLGSLFTDAYVPQLDACCNFLLTRVRNISPELNHNSAFYSVHAYDWLSFDTSTFRLLFTLSLAVSPRIAIIIIYMMIGIILPTNPGTSLWAANATYSTNPLLGPPGSLPSSCMTRPLSEAGKIEHHTWRLIKWWRRTVASCLFLSNRFQETLFHGLNWKAPDSMVCIICRLGRV